MAYSLRRPWDMWYMFIIIINYFRKIKIMDTLYYRTNLNKKYMFFCVEMIIYSFPVNVFVQFEDKSNFSSLYLKFIVKNKFFQRFVV